MRRLHSTLALVLAASACRPPATAPPPQIDSLELDRMPLVAAAHHAPLTAVHLDPRGRAALTLDADGEARLWPDVRASAGALPWALPLGQRVWISFAEVGPSVFVIAAIDGNGLTRLGRVDINAGTARWETVNELPIDSAMLEVHVLRDGRFVALSRSRRISLHARNGDWLAYLEPGPEAPQQLRVAEPPDGPPVIVAVFADPVRVRSIRTDEHKLAFVGARRAIALAQSPGRDELAISPDGTFLTALHRTGGGQTWSLERITLATSESRWISGVFTGSSAPRVQFIDPTHVLFASDQGQGLSIDLTAAVSDPTRARATARTHVLLAGSSAAALQSSVAAARTRAFVDGDTLTVQSLTDGQRLSITTAAFEPTGVALDPNGERVAWLVGGRLITERLGDPAAPRTIATFQHAPKLIVFIAPERLLVAGSSDVTLLSAIDGARVRTHRFRDPTGATAVAYHAFGEAHGELAWVDPSDSTSGGVLAVDGDDLGPQRELTAASSRWPELLPTPLGERQRVATLLSVVDAELTPAPRAEGAPLYVATRDRLAQIRPDGIKTISLDRGGVRTMAAAGHRVAVFESDDDEDFMVLGMYDFSGSTPRRLWARALATTAATLHWSADGRRLAVTAAGGLVLDADSGAALLTRRDLGLSVSRETSTRRASH